MNILKTPKLVRAVSYLYFRLCISAAFIAPPLMRVAIALPFFRSGLTRWDGFLSLSTGQMFLFEEQFKLHILRREFPLPFPDATAYLVGVLEILLPILLVLGLGTRIAATGIFAMTCVIQLIAPEGWANFHIYWAAISTGLIALGPGPISLDRFITARINDRAGGSLSIAHKETCHR